MSPIDRLLKMHGDRSLEWRWHCRPGSEPIFFLLDQGVVDLVNLKDFPQFYEELPDRVYVFTAAARRRYMELPREFGL